MHFVLQLLRHGLLASNTVYRFQRAVLTPFWAHVSLCSSHGSFQVVPGGGQAKFPLVLMVPHVQSFSQKMEYVINGCQFFTFEASPASAKPLAPAWESLLLECLCMPWHRQRLAMAGYVCSTLPVLSAYHAWDPETSVLPSSTCHARSCSVYAVLVTGCPQAPSEQTSKRQPPACRSGLRWFR